MIQAAMNIMNGFGVLHRDGYSYQDVNEGGFFINPQNGDVLICDNDNVAPNGVNLGVKGMPRYMAPEVVTDQQRPDSQTDKFSLAVLLFRLFYIDHPLEGQATNPYPLTDSTGAHFYGTHPVFCYDPRTEINRPDPNVQSNVISRWNIFPPDLKVTFYQAFVEGMLNRDYRVNETDWEETLVKVRGMLVNMNGAERFVNAYAKPIPEGIRVMQVLNYCLALGVGSKLYKCHVDKRSIDYYTVAAEVAADRSNPSVLVMRNDTKNEWNAKAANGATGSILPGGLVYLLPGMEIDFGHGAVGIIR
jgi:serine/threonine protein kinase